MYSLYYPNIIQHSSPTTKLTPRQKSEQLSKKRSSGSKSFGNSSLTKYRTQELHLHWLEQVARREEEFSLYKKDKGIGVSRYEENLLRKQEDRVTREVQAIELHSAELQKHQCSQYTNPEIEEVDDFDLNFQNSLSNYFEPGHSFTPEEQSIVRACIMYVIKGLWVGDDSLVNTWDFRRKIGFNRCDAIKLYEILNSTSENAEYDDWSIYDHGTNMWILIHNSVLHVLKSGSGRCGFWSTSWEGKRPTSRRLLEMFYLESLGGLGEVIERFPGTVDGRKRRI